uniref:Uncharacterized protein n=1 Tax=Stomoxys calcitrans TaxID=35570 RepID=A0A1I8PJN6_STOCA
MSEIQLSIGVKIFMVLFFITLAMMNTNAHQLQQDEAEYDETGEEYLVEYLDKDEYKYKESECGVDCLIFNTTKRHIMAFTRVDHSMDFIEKDAQDLIANGDDDLDAEEDFEYDDDDYEPDEIEVDYDDCDCFSDPACCLYDFDPDDIDKDDLKKLKKTGKKIVKKVKKVISNGRNYFVTTVRRLAPIRRFTIKTFSFARREIVRSAMYVVRQVVWSAVRITQLIRRVLLAVRIILSVARVLVYG